MQSNLNLPLQQNNDQILNLLQLAGPNQQFQLQLQLKIAQMSQNSNYLLPNQNTGLHPTIPTPGPSLQPPLIIPSTSLRPAVIVNVSFTGLFINNKN